MQVSQQLRLMHRQDFLNRFQFDDDSIADDEIYPVTAIKLDTLVDDRNFDLLTK